MAALDSLPALRGRLEELRRAFPGRYEALALVAQLLQGLPYLLAGSAAAYLHGLDLEPRDIDVVTNREGAYGADERLAPYVQVPMAYRDAREYAGHFGVYRVKGTRVEVVGDLVIRRPPLAYPVPLTPLVQGKATPVDVEGSPVPLVPAEDEVIAAVLAGTGKHRERLPHWLRVLALDRPYLEARMAEMDIPARFRRRVREECGLTERASGGPH